MFILQFVGWLILSCILMSFIEHRFHSRLMHRKSLRRFWGRSVVAISRRKQLAHALPVVDVLGKVKNQKVARRSESITRMAICIGCLLFSIMCQNYGAAAAPPESKFGDDESDKPTASHEEIADLGTFEGLRIVAQACLRSKKYDRAIELSKRAIAMDNDDMDVHRTYADALDHKLRTQVDQDPELFNACIKEWLIVLHSEVGDEKGMSWHGLTMPFAEKFYEDDERVVTARKRLTALAGSTPRPWETDTRYLKRVCKSTMAVQGKVISNTRKENSQDKNQPTLWLK